MDEKIFVFYICDDEVNSANELGALLSKICAELGVKSNIKAFDNPDDVINSCAQTHPDAVFMDIVLNDENGIEIAGEIAKKIPDTKIVFVTGYSDEYSQAIFLHSHKLRPYGYVAKPFQIDILKKILSIIISSDESLATITLSKNKRKFEIECNKILYIESYKRQIEIHLKNEDNFSVYMPISEIEKMLPDSFFRCHRSYIVNLDYVKEINEGQNRITLENDAVVYLGDTKKDDFFRRFFLFKGGL